MMILTKKIKEQLIKNHIEDINDTKPVVKLFGGSSCTWLLTDLDPETNVAFGLCDLGMNSPEMGYVSLYELEALKFAPFGLGVERDLHFEADKTLTEYWKESCTLGYIQA
mgnify:FL=1|tara:strand:+ start:605 stop:934 length:330 start_codon:yes stop_codon:yes gene_type:complete